MGSIFRETLITPGKDAPHIAWAFEQVAYSGKPVFEIMQEARRRGFTCSKSHFWYMLRNPVYCGLIPIPAYKDEPATVATGNHEPIISEKLFRQVQEVLDGRRRPVPDKHGSREELPLRGFLQCRRCGGRLTGSSSKGNGGRYFYYHCQHGCDERIKAPEANAAFETVLKCITAYPEAIQLYGEVLRSIYRKNGVDNSRLVKQRMEQMEKAKLRLINAQQLLLDGELTIGE